MDADRPAGPSAPPSFGGEGLLAASGGRPPAAEPMFRAPWPPLAISVLILGCYLLQTRVAEPVAFIQRFGFSPTDIERGRWGGLVTALFVHGNWTHAILNALGALAFGAPVARLFGTRAGGAAAFFGFYLICGAVSSLGLGLLHVGAASVLVGASGAIAGLMGASSRLIERRGYLAPFTSKSVIGMAGAWVAVNLAIAVVGLDLGAGNAPVAWEAHLIGYAAGLLLIGPLAWALRRD